MTKPEMQQVIDKLHSRISRTACECVYCHRVFAVNDPAWAEHWRECEKHPARAELADLRSQLKWTALELDRCKAEKAKVL